MCSLVDYNLEFIENFNLVDFLLEGNVYTWSNNQDPPVLYQIDHFLALVGWEKFFSDAVQCLLPLSILFLLNGGVLEMMAHILYEKLTLVSSIDGNAFFGGMMEFLEFIANLILEDFLSEGNVYTWSNNQDPPLLYQIDAFLALVRWEFFF